MQTNNESVLCFPKKYFTEERYRADNDMDTLLKIFHTPGTTEFLPRCDAETNTEFFQVIPYCVVCQPNKETGFPYEKILIYKRGTESTESRLHGLYSIGFGGHINPQDMESCLIAGKKFTPSGVAKACVRREITEELKLPKTSKGKTTHIVLHDPNTAVSAVHLGWVFQIPVDDPSVVSAKEEGIKDLQWVTLDELASEAWKDKLESWAAMLVAQFVKIRFFTAVHNGLKEYDK